MPRTTTNAETGEKEDAKRIIIALEPQPEFQKAAIAAAEKAGTSLAGWASSILARELGVTLAEPQRVRSLLPGGVDKNLLVLVLMRNHAQHAGIAEMAAAQQKKIDSYIKELAEGKKNKKGEVTAEAMGAEKAAAVLQLAEAEAAKSLPPVQAAAV